MLILMLLFIVKHFFCDFPLQPAWMYKNKGTYGHPGGIAHALMHMVGTSFFVYLPASVLVAGLGEDFNGWVFTPALVVIAESIAHYHIDYFKVRIAAAMGWGPTTHEQFWWLLGVDQLLHYLTYVWMIWVLVG